MTPRTIQLSPEEYDRFNSLRPVDGDAWRFWKEMDRLHGIGFVGTATTSVHVEQIAARAFEVISGPRKLKYRPGEKK